MPCLQRMLHAVRVVAFGIHTALVSGAWVAAIQNQLTEFGAVKHSLQPGSIFSSLDEGICKLSGLFVRRGRTVYSAVVFFGGRRFELSGRAFAVGIMLELIACINHHRLSDEGLAELRLVFVDGGIDEGHGRPATGGGVVEALVDSDAGALGIFSCGVRNSAAVEEVRAGQIFEDLRGLHGANCSRRVCPMQDIFYFTAAGYVL